MYQLLIRLMFVAAIIEFGFSLNEISECRSVSCASLIERATLDVLRIDWKPISVWPEEAKKFR